MRLCILSQKPELYSTRRVVEAAEEAGHDVSVVDYLRCSMDITAHNPRIMVGGREVGEIDAVLPRVAASANFYGTAVVRQFEMRGVYTVNTSQAISRSRDKLRCLQLLSRKGIAMPVTAFGHSGTEVKQLIETVGGAPLIVKLLEGTQGIGVVLCETSQAAESVIEAFRNLQANILVQEFIAEAAGADMRCFVVGKKVVASMVRQAPPGEFRSNIHRGGHGSKIKLTPEERSIAVRAAKAMNLRVAGVDMIRSKHGPLVIEVNSSPGLEGIEKATGVDVAGAIVKFIEREAVAGSSGEDRVEK